MKVLIWRLRRRHSNKEYDTPMNIHETYTSLVFQLAEKKILPNGKHDDFYRRFLLHATNLTHLYNGIYHSHPQRDDAFKQLINVIIDAYLSRSKSLKDRDTTKPKGWFLSNKLAGMSLYVDRFCGSLKNLPDHISYVKNLGVNTLHLMPVFKSPPAESDGGYAVSDFRKVDERFGTLKDLQQVQKLLQKEDMYLMLDIVLNHTSRQHEWAKKAREGDAYYQDFYYFFSGRREPDMYERTMPDIFPESSPGSFSYVEESDKWVMTVFHHYQWDLNYRNPLVLAAMTDTIFWYANRGVDILRIDAPAFIWKESGTTCQNLPQAHTMLQLIKQCVMIAAPGMAILGEAIVAPHEIVKYFGTGDFAGKECDFAYNATDMALQWDALATGDVRILLAAQHEVLRKPFGASWITYTRCHDDIGLGFDDYMIAEAGFQPYEHRRYLTDYYAGKYDNSPARGALFSVNEKTGDARISGSLASLCGLEKAITERDESAIEKSINKIILMQAHSFFIGGLPMIFYGDEAAYLNDYSYLDDAGKSYDNRWMHRPIIDWQKNAKTEQEGTLEYAVFSATQKLLSIRKKLDIIADKNNLTWLVPHNIHVSGYLRAWDKKRVYCLFNFSNTVAYLTWYTFKEHGMVPSSLYDHFTETNFIVGNDDEYLILQPYQFFILEVV